MRYKITSIASIIIFFCILFVGKVIAAEPTRPDINFTFSPEKEAKILVLSELSTSEIFKELQNQEFLVNKDYMNKAIFVTFKDREFEAVDYSMKHLLKPSVIVAHETGTPNYDFFVAKKILRMFPEPSVPLLLERYNQVIDPVIRVNIIHVLGKMEGGQNIQDMLIAALDDKTFWEVEYPEMGGKPLRICDEAYNQLVLRYRMKDVLRTIGNAHSIDVRDYHLELLKARF